MSKCKFKNLILSRQIWSLCSWLPRKPVNYYAFASAVCMQLLKHFIIIFLLFCLKLVFVERAGLTALANEIVCLPTDYVLPRQWQSKLPHAVLSACHDFYWGGGKSWRRKSLYHQVFALKMHKHCQKILYLFLSAYKTVHLKIGWIQTVETFFQSANHHQDHNVDPDAKLRLALVTDDLIN